MDALGQVVSRRDFLPFGEEVEPDETYRTTALKYGQADSVRQKFTGYQHDEETQLDFAEARMYQNLHGRFTAVDPLLASGKSADPQTFNRYVYVLNSPLILTDPKGLQAGQSTAKSRDFCIFSCNFVDKPYEKIPLGQPEYGLSDALADTGIGVAKWGWNSMAATSNAFYWGLERAAVFSSPDFQIHRTPYWEPSNQTQINAGIAMTGVSMFSGGMFGVRSTAPVAAQTASETTTLMPRFSLEFTNRVSPTGLKENAASIFNNGIKDPVKFTEIGGTNYILDGNHRTALSYLFNRDMVPAQRVSLPFGQFKTEADVLESAIPRAQVLNSSAVRYFDVEKYRQASK